MSGSRVVDGRTVPVPGVWEFDHNHTDIAIVARHLMVTKVRGRLTDFDGRVVVAEDPAESSVTIEAKASSIDTGTTDRDAHLRSGDFLDADHHPLITFRSTKLAPAGEGWKLTGDLTIRGTTKPVTFDLSFDGTATDPWGNTKAAFTVTGEIDREQWGLVWNVPLEGGGWLVSRKFQVEIEAQAKPSS